MGQRAYKQVTAQQLRSFCETARRGSLSAAATALGLGGFVVIMLRRESRQKGSRTV